MHKGKSPSSTLTNQKHTRLNQNPSYFQSKEKTQTLIKVLQEQNKKLKESINILKKQKSELLSYKEKYLALNLKSPIQKEKLKQKQNSEESIYQTVKRFSHSPVTLTQQGSLSKAKIINSARKQPYIPQSDKNPQTGLLDDQLIHKYQSSIAQKKKRFNYISDFDQIPIKSTQLSLNKTLDPKCLETQSPFKANQPKLKQSSIENTDHRNSQSEYGIKDLKNSKSISIVTIQALEKQLVQMRRIQGQLLDRIQQRDNIIEGLKNLLMQG